MPKLSPELKKQISSVLLTHTSGVKLHDFQKQFKDFVGLRLDTAFARSNGFNSLLDLFESLDDIVRYGHTFYNNLPGKCDLMGCSCDLLFDMAM